MTGERREDGPAPGRGAGTLEHDAEADREYTTPERTAALDRESPAGAPAPAPGEDVREEAVERHAAPGAEGADLDEARELPGRDLEEEAAVRREADSGEEPPRRR